MIVAFSVDAAKVCDLLEWYRANKIAVFPYEDLKRGKA